MWISLLCVMKSMNVFMQGNHMIRLAFLSKNSGRSKQIEEKRESKVISLHTTVIIWAMMRVYLKHGGDDGNEG